MLGHAMNPIFTDHLPMNLHAREHHIVRPELDIYFSSVINFDIKDPIYWLNTATFVCPSYARTRISNIM